MESQILGIQSSGKNLNLPEKRNSTEAITEMPQMLELLTETLRQMFFKCSMKEPLGPLRQSPNV